MKLLVMVFAALLAVAAAAAFAWLLVSRTATGAATTTKARVDALEEELRACRLSKVRAPAPAPIPILGPGPGPGPGTGTRLFAQVGYLASGDEHARLPLYGRASSTRRHRVQYYTVDHSGIQVPVAHQGRDCMEEVACEELYDGDVVGVGLEAAAKTYTVRLYAR